MIHVRTTGLLLVLLGARVALGCSIEIWSIAETVTRARNVVVGTVESIDGEILDTDPETGWVQWAIRSAVFRVERVLRGDLSLENIVLRFDPELSRSSCAGMLLPYQEGARLLLVLGEEADTGSYEAPLVPPRLLSLPDEYEATPLFGYVQAVLSSSQPPIQVAFQGPPVTPLGDPLHVEVQVSNQVDFPVAVVLAPGDPGVAGASAATLWFHFRVPGGNTVPLRPDRREAPALWVIAPGQTELLSVDLGNYYSIPAPGEYELEGTLNLLSFEESFYQDNWSNFGPQYRFTVRAATAVAPIGWGYLKFLEGSH